jgi:hypothetical protein
MFHPPARLMETALQTIPGTLQRPWSVH